MIELISISTDGAKRHKFARAGVRLSEVCEHAERAIQTGFYQYIGVILDGDIYTEYEF